MFMESIGRGFAEMHGINVLVARLGWCPRTREQVVEIAANQWSQDVYFSPGDAGRFFACAVEASDNIRLRPFMRQAVRCIGHDSIWPPRKNSLAMSRRSDGLRAWILTFPQPLPAYRKLSVD
jgi:hypothetical protein